MSQLTCRTGWRARSMGRAWLFFIWFVGIEIGLVAPNASAYSVLSHEEIVDIAWKDKIQPVLLARFPAATEGQLHRAHAYAYGGCLIQDIGYYPFGNKFFS